MGRFKEEYEKISEQRETIKNAINWLESNIVVKKYLQLKKENDDLYTKQLVLYSVMKNEEYSECSHVLVNTNIENYGYGGRKHRSCGCIKCGLDNQVLDKEIILLTYNEKIKYNYLRKHSFYGKITEYSCDIDLATSIYSKIKEAHPEIDDETAIKYFEIALDNIRNIPVSDERKANRAKRLLLDPEFNKWHVKDIRNN